jgi:hypothetical protein
VLSSFFGLGASMLMYRLVGYCQCLQLLGHGVGFSWQWTTFSLQVSKAHSWKVVLSGRSIAVLPLDGGGVEPWHLGGFERCIHDQHWIQVHSFQYVFHLCL